MVPRNFDTIDYHVAMQLLCYTGDVAPQQCMQCSLNAPFTAWPIPIIPVPNTTEDIVGRYVLRVLSTFHIPPSRARWKRISTNWEQGIPSTCLRCGACLPWRWLYYLLCGTAINPTIIIITSSVCLFVPTNDTTARLNSYTRACTLSTYSVL